jgi:hypothetical protein
LQVQQAPERRVVGLQRGDETVKPLWKSQRRADIARHTRSGAPSQTTFLEIEGVAVRWGRDVPLKWKAAVGDRDGPRRRSQFPRRCCPRQRQRAHSESAVTPPDPTSSTQVMRTVTRYVGLPSASVKSPW